jgi:hypothetical protein
MTYMTGAGRYRPRHAALFSGVLTTATRSAPPYDADDIRALLS